MSRLIFDADTLGGTTTLSSADAVGNFTLIVPAVNGTLSVKDASNDATFRNITLTGAVLAGAWNGSTIAVAYGGTGATTLTGYVKGNGTSAMTASSTIPNTDITGLGTMSVQGSDAVTITGGTANGLTIGAVNPAAGTFTTLRFNSTLSANGSIGTSGQVLTSNGASAPTWQSVAGVGTVTSVDGSGGTTGLTLTGGPITSSGTLTLGGTLAVANGGTGAVTLTGYVKGSGTSAMTASATIPNTDITGLGTMSTQAASAVAITGGTIADTSITVKDNVFTLQDDVDPTKQAQFQLSSLTTGTIFSYVLPLGNGSASNLVDQQSTQTITGIKTFSGGVTFSAASGSYGTNANASTYNYASGATTTGLTKTVNFGTGGLSGSTTNIAIGSNVSGATSTTTMNGTSLFAGTGYAANFALTDAATVAWDTNNQVATFTFVSTNRTFGAPTNLKNGGFYALAVIQNAGSNTLTWNSVFKWAAGTAPTLSTAAGAKDYFTFRSDGVSLFQQGISQAVA
jgi:hypothetical protein